jgi:hypothetical protein
MVKAVVLRSRQLGALRNKIIEDNEKVAHEKVAQTDTRTPGGPALARSLAPPVEARFSPPVTAEFQPRQHGGNFSSARKGGGSAKEPKRIL